MQFGWGWELLESVKWLSLSPYCLVENNPGGFPMEEPQSGSFLTQFTPLPVQRGANCTSWSASPGGFILMERRHCLHNYPLSSSSTERQLASRDSPQPQPHSRLHWATWVPEGMTQLQYLQWWGHANPVLAAPERITAFPILEAGWGRESWKKLE